MTTKWKRGLGYSEEIYEEKENAKTGNAKQKKVFKSKRPLSILVKFVNYEPAFKFKMNKSEIFNSVESVINSSEESIHVFNKRNSSTSKIETKVYRVKEKNIGLLSKGKLKKKLDDVTGTIKARAPKRNRNGKQGIN